MRLFTAIEIPDEIRGRLADLVREFRPLPKLRWTPAENLHITTKFIGEWPEPKLPSLIAQLEHVPFPSPIPITIKNLAWIKHRILHATVEAPPTLAQLASATENALEELGVPKEDRDYHPHLTLARNPNRISLAPLNQAIEKHAAEIFGTFTGTHFALFLSKAGKYTLLNHFG